jgi:N-succinyldiaminopimelate aminotransferase
LPDGGFYLWPGVDDDDAHFTRALYQSENLTVLPGSFMARDAHGENPGRGRVRISLVPELARCVEAAERLRRFLVTRPASGR